MCVHVNGCCMYNCACLCSKHPRSSTRVPSRTLHHPANPLYSIIILSHPFPTPGHFSSHVLQPSHIHHCTTSLEWPTIWTPHHSISLPPQHIFIRLLYPSPPGLPLKMKMSSLQTLLPWPIWSFIFSIWTTPTLTATLSLVVFWKSDLSFSWPPLETPFWRALISYNGFRGRVW